MRKLRSVLVTGGSGFIGSHVVDNLLGRGIRATVLDRNPHRDQPPDVEVFLGDVRDSNAVMEAVSKHDGVIHLAAMLGTQETVPNPEPAVQTNILGSLNIFRAVQLYSKPAVYISVGNWWMNNPYSITKTTAERFAFMWNREYGTKIAVVRGLNVYGPRQKDRPVRKMIPNFILPTLRGEDITVYGTGNQVMDMIYVTDMAEILVRALLSEHDVYDQVFQAGMGNDTTVNLLVQTIVRLTGSTSQIRHVPMRPGEIPDSVVRADKTTWNLEKLNWAETDFIPLEEGLKRTIEWYRHELSFLR